MKRSLLVAMLLLALCTLVSAQEGKKKERLDSQLPRVERGRKDATQRLDVSRPSQNRGTEAGVSHRIDTGRSDSQPRDTRRDDNSTRRDSSTVRRNDQNRSNNEPVMENRRQNENNSRSNPPIVIRQRSDDRNQSRYGPAITWSREEKRPNNSTLIIRNREDDRRDRRPVEYKRNVIIDSHHYDRRGPMKYQPSYRTNDTFIFLATVAILAISEKRLDPDEIAKRHETYFQYRNKSLSTFREDYADLHYVYYGYGDWPEWIPTYTYYMGERVKLFWSSEYRCFGFIDPEDRYNFIEYNWYDDEVMANRLMNLHYYRWRIR